MSNDVPDNEIDRLVKMLEYIRKTLLDFLEYYNQIIPEYPEFRGMLKDNWPQINDHFDTAMKFLKTEVNWDSLEREGLTGNQLKLKFLLLKSAYDEVSQKLGEYVKTNDNSPEKKGKLNWFRRHLGAFFHYGNSVLGSMAAAGVPFVGVIGEFKDAAESVIERSQSKNK